MTRTQLTVGSIMHSRTFLITVSNDRALCRPHLEEKLRTVAWLPLAIFTSCLEQLNLLKKSVNDSSAHRLDHCDAIALRSRFGVPHSEIELSLQQLIWDQTQTNTRIEHLEAHASNPAGRFMPLI